MIRPILVLWLLFASPALAAPVQVKAGEHNGFTRLVVDYGKAVKWQVGRTEDGYELRIDGAQPDYDVTQSFKIIGTGRLVSLVTDAKSGDLRIGVACACYAIPFEFRDGIIVVDLRDGMPPKGSGFEAPLPLLQKDPAPVPDQPVAAIIKPYDWTSLVVAQATGKPMLLPPPDQGSQINIDGLRETLVRQLGQGASQGIIELAPLKPERHPVAAETPAPEGLATVQPSETHGVTVATAAAAAEFASVRSGLGELPSISITHGAPEHQNIGAKGEVCLSAASLDVAAWRGEGAVADEMQRATENLIGEFDRVDPDVLGTAVRFYLSIGFGAEAKQLMRAFPIAHPDTKLWNAMADLVDGNPDISDVFHGQLGCDSPAALWALLANEAVQKGDFVNSGAIYLAFSSLPIDLRRSLAPALASRFLSMHDSAMATKVRDAAMRAPGVAGPAMTLLDAQIDMHDGMAPQAEHKIQSVVDDPGPKSTDATVALIEARVAQDLPVEADLVALLSAMAQEHQDLPDAATIRRALTLAQAASGDFDSAFKVENLQSELSPTLWRLLSRLGNDDAVLAHAVLDRVDAISNIDHETRIKLASRLADLGMAESAYLWIDKLADVDPLLMAKIDLQRRDARGALVALQNSEAPDALPLRAAALQQLGDEAAVARLLEKAGDAQSALEARARAQDWSTIALADPGALQAVAGATEATPLPANAKSVNDAPLAFGKSLLGQASSTRSAVAALLAQTAQP